MAILPVSSVSVKSNNRNLVNFAGRKTEDSEERLVSRPSSRPAAAVPVVVLMAMSPSLLNSKTPVMPEELNAPNITMLAPEIPEESVSTAGFNEVQQSSTPSRWIRPNEVQYQERFSAENKNWTMYYTSDLKSIYPNTKNVGEIYLVPDDYKKVYDKDTGREISSPPQIEKLICHDLGKGKEFLGAYVLEALGGKYRYREIRLPDKTADNLLSLLVNQTEFEPPEALVKSFTFVKTEELAPTIYKDAINKDFY